MQLDFADRLLRGLNAQKFTINFYTVCVQALSDEPLEYRKKDATQWKCKWQAFSFITGYNSPQNIIQNSS